MPKRIAILAVAAVALVVALQLALRESATPPSIPERPREPAPAIDPPAPPSTEQVIRASIAAPVGTPEAVPEPAYASPEQIEDALLQLLARHPQLGLVSINSVACDAVTCEIALSGSQVAPRVVGQVEMGIHESLFAQRWADVRVSGSSVGTREIAPGARETVFSFEYQPLVDLSGDRIVAARQQARCSAAWVRQTKNPAPDEVVRRYLDMARQRLALAAAVLGEEEAKRIVAQTNGGPLIRECGLTP
jgi:hypothetical protein